jgi:hypothetical protein
MSGNQKAKKRYLIVKGRKKEGKIALMPSGWKSII